MTKVFIDGSEGTTGLRIYERFEKRDDIEIIKIDPELRKDPEERARLINSSDITFLCLPDAASKESVSLVSNPDVRIIDASTAHRTEEGWAYGYPELSNEHREAIKTGKRIAVPGCYATGFITIAYPLVKGGIVPKDYPVSAFAVSGYSGAGKKTIAVYEDKDRDVEFDSPREYALSQQHKHLKEMQKISGLSRTPLFSPIIADYYSGMFVSLPFYADMLNGKQTPLSIHEYMSEYFKGQRFIKVMPFGSEADTNGFIGANNLSGWDGLQLFVTGNEERILLTTRFDNLGKGASGAAIQCMNVMLGCDEAKGLNL
ncbi:MAG: N-acetyl-gamma-glutamyl-phosphate reductase [Lachnospiraceae bacterium]|nr:N-acetyl-gamma-glutamyl-phosphate reductase [Lachnospiraceae bacterium]